MVPGIPTNNPEVHLGVNVSEEVKKGEKSTPNERDDQAISSHVKDVELSGGTAGDPSDPHRPPNLMQQFSHIMGKFARFVGPGFLVSVAYIDPGNYSTDAAAGAAARFKLLFIVLLSNLFAIFLQSLCIKLGSVTGLNLAENCRKHLPKWLNIVLYIFAEAAIIATDIAEVCFFFFDIFRYKSCWYADRG